MNQRIWIPRICCLLLWLWPPVLAAQLGSTFHDVAVNYKYPGTYRDIRQVDFRNLTAYYLERSSRPSDSFPLKNGKYVASSQSGEESVSLDSVHPLKESGAEQYALVTYEWDSIGGSSGQNGIAQVFLLSGGRLQIVQQIDWDWHYGGPYTPFSKLFDDKAVMLTFPSAHYLDGDAHCCVSAIDIVEMRWNGRRFIRSAMHTELSDYGKEKGKKLTQ
jgi:hypothetical protein